MDKVSVIICNHNYGRYIEKSINSAINQTYKPFNICIIDDASTDNSWDIISKFAETNQLEERTIESNNGDILIKVGNLDKINIIGIKLPSSAGPSDARNVGIHFCWPSTDIYSILDADDEMLPNKIEECMKPFQDEMIGLTYANYFNINEDTGVSLLEVKEPYRVERLNQQCIVHSGFLIRRSVLEQVQKNWGYWYDPQMRTCEDWDLEIRASLHCLFYHIPLPLTNVLVHNNNSTNTVKSEIWQSNWNRIRDKYFRENNS